MKPTVFWVVVVAASVLACSALAAPVVLSSAKVGGGNTPDSGPLDARKAAASARSQMDNSLFAVDDFAVIPGADIAWVDGIREALRLAKKHDRPVFLFTHDGHMDVGRC